MTRINKMVMRGFKSFAKHTELVFGPDYNCVLGPNGSGKSNVLDALCFVLGKTSAKSMRAEKSSNLIYNGGKAKSPAKEGEVSIYFDNTSRRFPTDDPEVKITRIVRQNGQSIYKINDKVRTRQEIIDLLSLAKIDPDGYNIILQGDITRFVEMPPLERRMLIEEISGISIYEEKKQKAISQLDKVEERLKEAEIVLAERNTYLKELKKDRDQAQKYKEMEDNVRQNKATLLFKQMERQEQEHQKLKEGLDKAKEALKKVNEEIQFTRSSILQKKESVESLGKEIEQKGEVELVCLNREIEELKIEVIKKRSRVETISHELDKISQRRKDLESTKQELGEKSKSLAQQHEHAVQQKKALEQERVSILEKIQQFRSKNSLEGLADIEKKIEAIDREAEELQKTAHAQREQQHNLIREKDRIETQLSMIDEQLAKVETLAKEHKAEIEKIKQQRARFKEVTLQLNVSLNEDSSLAVQIDKSRAKLGEAREEVAKLEARSASLRESAKLDSAMEKILKLKETQPGIFGTIFQLGNVESKYATAIEKAAGPRIKSIIVEDEKVAAGLINYLKQQRLGTASFLPLSVLQAKETHSDVVKLSKAKGCHGLALDLVEYDPKFRKAFLYIFADTLVVDNIDVARRLGIGKAKMVSLDGDIAEKSGVMAGGYHTKKSGLRFSEKEIESELTKAGELQEELQETVTVLEKRRKENEETITTLRLEKGSLEGEIIKAEKSLHLAPTDLDITMGKKDELKEQGKTISRDVDKLSEVINAKNRELADNKIEKQKLRDKIATLRDPKLLAELATFEERRNQLSEELAKIDGELANTSLQGKDIIAPEQEKIGKIVKQLAKDGSQFATEKDYLMKELVHQEAGLAKKESSAKEFHSKYKGLFEERHKLETEINTLESKVLQKTDESRKVEINENTLTLKHAEAAAALSGQKQEFSQYEGVPLATGKTEDQLKYELGKFEKMKLEIGSVNMRALEVYEQVEKEFNALLEKKDTLAKEREDVLSLMQEIETKKKELFMQHFDKINSNFKDTFARLSTKGEATLELETPQNPFEGGIGIKVRMSGARFLDIRSLSGGEKTMTALAFIFSIQDHEPASFYILDEVDAALDKNNSEKLAKLIQKYSEKAQYIIISHNDGVITTANTLYGVSMDEHGMSKVVSLRV